MKLYKQIMAGTNPYIEKAEFELPLQNYDVTFLPMQKKVTVLSEKITTESDGLSGSILNAALEAGIDMDHSCGGVCACSPAMSLYGRDLKAVTRLLMMRRICWI